MAKRCTICYGNREACVKKKIFKTWYNLAFEDKSYADISVIISEYNPFTSSFLYDYNFLTNKTLILDDFITMT